MSGSPLIAASGNAASRHPRRRLDSCTGGRHPSGALTPALPAGAAVDRKPPFSCFGRRLSSWFPVNMIENLELNTRSNHPATGFNAQHTLTAVKILKISVAGHTGTICSLDCTCASGRPHRARALAPGLSALVTQRLAGLRSWTAWWARHLRIAASSEDGAKATVLGLQSVLVLGLQSEAARTGPRLRSWDCSRSWSWDCEGNGLGAKSSGPRLRSWDCSRSWTWDCSRSWTASEAMAKATVLRRWRSSVTWRSGRA